MAKASFKMPDEFLLRLSRLGEKTDEIITKVLEAGAGVVEEKVRSNLRAVIDRDTKEPSQPTGRAAVLPRRISGEARPDGNYNVKVGFAEPRSSGKATP